MSDILIKNMEMPKFCFDEKRWKACFYAEDCKLGLEMAKNFKFDCKPEGCPLVEVKPHGRLIDADALVDGKSYLIESVDGRIRTIVELCDIEDAPTVLEASNDKR